MQIFALPTMDISVHASNTRCLGASCGSNLNITEISPQVTKNISVQKPPGIFTLLQKNLQIQDFFWTRSIFEQRLFSTNWQGVTTIFSLGFHYTLCSKTFMSSHYVDPTLKFEHIYYVDSMSLDGTFFTGWIFRTE